MNCLNSSLFKDGASVRAVARAEVGARDTTEVGVGVPLPSVRAAPASLSLQVGKGFQQRLWQARGPVIGLDKKLYQELKR